MTDTPHAGERPSTDQRSFAALRLPAARTYLACVALAMMADSIEHVISYWIMYQKFHSPALGGFAVISHWLPFLLFSFYTGALADRFDPRRIVQIGMVMFMVASLGWGLLFLTDTLDIWHAAMLLVLHGLAAVLWSPAGQLLVHEFVAPAQLQSAIRMMATARTLGILVGPAVGGGIMLLFGPANGILFNVLIYLPLILWLWNAPLRRDSAERRTPVRRSVNGFTNIADTVRRAAAIPIVITMTALAGTAALMVGNAYQAQMPEFAIDLGSGTDGLRYSLLFAANGIGALVAGVVLESRSLLPAAPRNAFMLALMWCGAIGSFAITSSYAVALLLLFSAGFLDLSFNSMARTLAQLHAPDDIRGRVVGLYNMGSMGLRTFSGVTVGLGGSVIGIHWSLGLSAAVLFVAITTLFTVMMRKRLDAAPRG